MLQSETLLCAKAEIGILLKFWEKGDFYTDKSVLLQL